MLLPAAAGIRAGEVTGADVSFLGGGVTAAAVGAAAGALLVVTRVPRPGRVGGGLTALPATIGCRVTRATPVPAGEGDYGTWREPLGVCSPVVQGIVVRAVVAPGGPVRLRPGHLLWEARSVVPGLRPDGPGSGSPGGPPAAP
ncbi:hypothetical protein [Streptomyces sp. NPDC050388]|uniref:hypothetical protein n=1 Tax=Streptomyces sp. NPDC050388 TaxID=3155781 RepID=UPI0034233201